MDLEKTFNEIREIYKRDPEMAISLMKSLVKEIKERIAEDWDGSIPLSQYASARRYPDFFHEMADRIEWSFKFVERATKDEILMALSSLGFLMEVYRRLGESSKKASSR